MRKKSVLIIVIAVIVVFAGFSYVIYDLYNKPISFVSISINPDIELAVNSNSIVESVEPINDDADIIVSDLNLVGKTVEEASKKIVDAAIETGYIDEYSDDNTVVVTTVNNDEKTRIALENKIINNLNQHFEARKVYPILVAKGLNDDLKAQADKYNISNGKMLLIDYAVALNPNLKVADLVGSSIQSIQKDIIDYVKKRHAALKESLMDLKARWQQEKQDLKQDYQARVQALRNNISEEQKDAFKNMSPIQKKQAIDAALQKMKDQIKAEVNGVKDDIKQDTKSDMSNYNYPVLENNAETIKNNIKDRIKEHRNK